MNTERLIMVRESTYREMREALRESLHYFEFYGCPICGGDCASANPPVTGCPIHSARRALAHPTPDGCGREGRHQWGGPQRNREVCVNCGATRTLEVPDTKGPYETRFVGGGMPSDCCEYGVISLSEGREVCRVWREQDARAIASALSAFTAGGDDG